MSSRSGSLIYERKQERRRTARALRSCRRHSLLSLVPIFGMAQPGPGDCESGRTGIAVESMEFIRPAARRCGSQALAPDDCPEGERQVFRIGTTQTQRSNEAGGSGVRAVHIEYEMRRLQKSDLDRPICGTCRVRRAHHQVSFMSPVRKGGPQPRWAYPGGDGD